VTPLFGIPGLAELYDLQARATTRVIDSETRT
jgi:hypothetical protein